MVAGIVIVAIVAMLCVTAMSIVTLIGSKKAAAGLNDIKIKFDYDTKETIKLYDDLMDHVIKSMPEMYKEIAKITEELDI